MADNTNEFRFKSSARNAMTAAVTSIVMGVVSFIERMVFNQCFISDYLGFYSLFGNIISIIAVAELGLSTAIAYSLYAPLAEDNFEEVNVIMHLFRKVYRIMGTIILAAGHITTEIVGHKLQFILQHQFQVCHRMHHIGRRIVDFQQLYMGTVAEPLPAILLLYEEILKTERMEETGSALNLIGWGLELIFIVILPHLIQGCLLACHLNDPSVRSDAHGLDAFAWTPEIMIKLMDLGSFAIEGIYSFLHIGISMCLYLNLSHTYFQGKIMLLNDLGPTFSLSS